MKKSTSPKPPKIVIDNRGNDHPKENITPDDIDERGCDDPKENIPFGDLEDHETPEFDDFGDL
jgi:hypothetical protein